MMMIAIVVLMIGDRCDDSQYDDKNVTSLVEYFGRLIEKKHVCALGRY